MTALAHPTPSFPAWGTARRRRHLALVPAPAPESLADVLFLPTPVPEVVAPRRSRVRRPVVRAAVVQPPPARVSEVPLRLTVRGRRVLVALVLMGAAVLGGALGAVVSTTAAPVTETVEVTVEPGQTLWAVAVAATPSGGDVRDVVEQIRQANGLTDSTVVAGQVLAVPERG